MVDNEAVLSVKSYRDMVISKKVLCTGVFSQNVAQRYLSAKSRRPFLHPSYIFT